MKDKQTRQEKQGKHLNLITTIITNRNLLVKTQARAVYFLTCIIAFVMSVTNYFTGRETLLIYTAVFSVLCAINLLISLGSEKLNGFASTLFTVELIALFSYFIVTGGTDNFSIIWVLLLPTVGISFFGFRKGTVMSAAVLAIMLVCFYVPQVREHCTDYGATFRLRFPLVFISCYAVSMVLEYVRAVISGELERARERYKYLSEHDVLTGLYNRSVMDECTTLPEGFSGGSVAMLSFDIDFFKNVNDTYGHAAGDEVLKALADTVRSVIPADARAFRTGGEEFMVFYYDGSVAQENAERLRREMEMRSFTFRGDVVNVTISLGLARVKVSDNMPSFDKVFEYADNLLYKAKKNGRNRLVCGKIS